MSDLLKAALVLGVSLIVSVLIWTFFSPHQTCMRAGGNALICARAAAGG